MELLILRHLRNNETSINRADILDIGSGSGHWIDFYKSLEPETITGMDVSLSSFNYLKKKYTEDSSIEIHQGKALETINALGDNYDLVNAIGVMFHIVDDFEWQETIKAIEKTMKNSGAFVVGGHFGFWDGLNMQIDKDGNINKRLRSKRRWIHELRKAGFTSVKVYRNNAYLWIKDTLPENSVLIATK
jgi:SAM-dependent methyltransferase